MLKLKKILFTRNLLFVKKCGYLSALFTNSGFFFLNQDKLAMFLSYRIGKSLFSLKMRWKISPIGKVIHIRFLSFFLLYLIHGGAPVRRLKYRWVKLPLWQSLAKPVLSLGAETVR